MLNSGANVVFQGMEPGTDQMKLHAASFGVQMPAAANLSECQLNCLGLSVWVMQATSPGSPFGFIVLDDPVQAMDDDHAEAFLSTMVPHLIDSCGKQVNVLSHVQSITDRLQAINLGTRTGIFTWITTRRPGRLSPSRPVLPKCSLTSKGARRVM